MQGPLCAGPFLQVARDRRHRGQMFYWRAVTVSVLPMRLGAHGYWGPRSNHAPMVSRSSPTPAGTTILRHRCIPCDRVPAARLPSLALGSLVGLDTTRGPGEQVHTGGGGGGMGGGFVWAGPIRSGVVAVMLLQRLSRLRRLAMLGPVVTGRRLPRRRSLVAEPAATSWLPGWPAAGCSPSATAAWQHDRRGGATEEAFAGPGRARQGGQAGAIPAAAVQRHQTRGDWYRTCPDARPHS